MVLRCKESDRDLILLQSGSQVFPPQCNVHGFLAANNNYGLNVKYFSHLARNMRILFGYFIIEII